MTRVSPQVLVQLARRTVERELKWTRTELHAPPIPEGAVTDDPLAELSPLDVRLIQQLGFRAYHDAATQRLRPATCPRHSNGARHRSGYSRQIRRVDRPSDAK